MKTVLPLAILILTGCFRSVEPVTPKKPDPPVPGMPAITQVGKNRFGCLVNGKEWVARTQVPTSNAITDLFLNLTLFAFSGNSGPQPSGATIHPTNYDSNGRPITCEVTLNGLLYDDYRGLLEEITLTLESSAFKTGTFKLTDNGSKRVRHTDYHSRCYSQYPGNSYDSIGYMTISRFDTAAKIIAGTFAFSFPSHDSCTAVSATDGRFDFTYKIK